MGKVIRLQQFAIVACVFGLLSACVTVPKAPDQLLYATYATYIAVENGTAQALDTHSISADQAQQIQRKLQQIVPRLAAARQLVQGGHELPQNTVEYLQATQRLLASIQAQLEADHGN